ncbi:MAG: sulfate reduction electron transfer complex DsrMKJOP subunit DsrO [Anaerolineae bacterium]
MSKRLNRRDFLKVTALAAGAAAATRAAGKAAASENGSHGPNQWAMVIDQSKCIGCGYCTLACQAHNHINPDIQWTRVEPAGRADGAEVFLPRPCMQCTKAPCVDVCHVKAPYYRSGGIVMMDYDRCIGCRYCEVACPYQARSFNWKAFDGPNPAIPKWGQAEVERRPRGVVEKCSFCYQRIDRGLALGLEPGVDADATPACVVACPVGARIFGDLNDPESNVSKALQARPTYRLRESLGTEPRVYYIPAGAKETEG